MKTLPVEIQGVSLVQIKAEMSELDYPNLSAPRKEFFKSLSKWENPTEKQAWWMRHLYGVALGLDKEGPSVAELVANVEPAPSVEEVAPAVAEMSYKPVFQLFETASKNLKYPAIKLNTADKKPVMLKPAGVTSKNNGAIYVSDGGPYGNNQYYGKITPEGNFQAKFGLSPEKVNPIKELLGELAIDPAGVAAKAGHMTGACCFCKKALTDPQSVKAGFGPICAKVWGLLDQYNAS